MEFNFDQSWGHVEIAPVKPFCVFCLKNGVKLQFFTEGSLTKSHEVLNIRKTHNLSFKDVELPFEVENLKKHHIKCYWLFISLPPNYRRFIKEEELEASIASVRPYCVFCLKESPKPRYFKEGTLNECLEVLNILKANNLSFKDVELPSKVDNLKKYHPKCFRLFTSLPPIYRNSIKKEKLEASTSTAAIQKKEEVLDGDDDYSATSTTNGEGEKTFKIEHCEDNSDVFFKDEFCITQEQKYVNAVCIFCNRRQKIHNHQHQTLVMSLQKTADDIESTALQLGDIDFVNKIRNKREKSNIFYHGICRITYNHILQPKHTANVNNKIEWHTARIGRKKAFEEVRRFVSENIVKKGQSFSLSFLTLFIENLKKHIIGLNISYCWSTILIDKLLNTFPKQISIIPQGRQRMVKPYQPYKSFVLRSHKVPIKKTKYQK